MCGTWRRQRRRNFSPAPLYFGRLLSPLLLGVGQRPGLSRRPCVIPFLGTRLQWGGGTKQKKKLRRLERIAKIQKTLEVPEEGNTYTWGGCYQ